MVNKLNWGCAFDIREGWTNSDLIDYGQEHVGDLLAGLPFADDYFDCIVANHSLQMIRFDDLPRALAELRRVLKRGGTIRILVPDAENAIQGWQEGNIEYFPIADDIEAHLDGKFLRYLFWHGDARCAFTFKSLKSKLEANRFQNVVRSGKFSRSGIKVITELDSRLRESLIVEAIK